MSTQEERRQEKLRWRELNKIEETSLLRRMVSSRFLHCRDDDEFEGYESVEGVLRKIEDMGEEIVYLSVKPSAEKFHEARAVVPASVKLLRGSACLTVIELTGCGVRDEDAAALAEAIMANESCGLKHLGLTHNEFGNRGANVLIRTWFAHWERGGRRFTGLDLRYNRHVGAWARFKCIELCVELGLQREFKPRVSISKSVCIYLTDEGRAMTACYDVFGAFKLHADAPRIIILEMAFGV